MKNFFSKKAASVLVACALSATSVHTAHAQGPGFSGSQLIGNQTTGTFYMTAGNGGDKSSYLQIAGLSNAEHGNISYIAGWSPNNSTHLAHSFFLRPANDNNVVLGMGIRQSGLVQIGNRLPSTQPNCKLAVDGMIVSTSMYVTNPNNWADFVFEPNYKPIELPILESYLRANKHLPYIPSAKEVEANGYNVADMDAKLLRTVEELTLQVIELAKQNKQMQNRLNSLESQSEAVTGRK